jgi:hypothetical protein
MVAIGYLVAWAVVRGRLNPDILIVLIGLTMPLALIWFPIDIGSYIGPAGRGRYIDTPTPGIFIAFAGWFFLIALPLILYFIWKSG